ncbi:DUF3857 and transglutaminase domain-containing protein [Seonamhaeicola sp.]|uniref:DUF3857 domain-containing transglutaminase family protein n=1 Tax=Seonamhaeicola sp. TaxID=1912245 RepID=UPI00261AF91C|nr:DUF3857 and transglutaminase domain-containing protein [Seonamhaeicola sp.]
MRNTFIGLLVTFCFSLQIHSQVIKAAEPTWISKVQYSNSEIDINDVEAGTYTLLFDSQANIPMQTVYHRFVTKITDNVGIQNASNINVSYDPTYQKLKFHKINIIRGDAVINKLNVSNFQVMRRELNAENHLYDGSLSAVMNISDVRTDDVIDYAYSITGFNPIHKNKFSHSFYLSDFESVGKVNATLLSKNEFDYKSFNTSKEPAISKENNLYKYQWVSTNTKALDYEDNTPSWKLLYETIIVSEYNSWKEVVDWGLDVYHIKDNIDAELQAKIDDIDSANKDIGDKIKATLNFVQNDIRYLGLESGIGAYKPFSPNQVFKQRFGDCKDKSLLMTTMLKKMGIEAYPMLVNTSLKHTIKEFLPSPKFFDHCVVKVIKDKVGYYYDPTISNQGGDYDSTHFPDYGFGLVIKKDNEGFDEIKTASENKIEIQEEYTIMEVGKGANLKVTTTYYESEADNMRNYFKNNSIGSIKKEYERFYSNYYYNVSSVNPPKFEDNTYGNVFKVYEEYLLDSIWQPMPEKENHIAVNFIPSSLIGTLYVPTKDQREAEVSMIYPIIREHKINISLPMDWGIENDKLFVNSDGFYYEWKVGYDKAKKEIDLYYYLETQKDHITKDEYKQYIQDIKKVDQTTGYYIFIPENYAALSLSSKNGDVIFNGIIAIVKILLIIGVIIVITLFVFWYVNKRKAH